MRAERMARRNILVEAACVLYLEAAPPAWFDAGGGPIRGAHRLRPTGLQAIY
jgi:hypothetical protein